jgi:hypothetical protein
VSAIASDHMVKCPGKFHSRFSCHGAHYGISPADNAVRTPDPVMPTLSSELIRARDSCSFRSSRRNEHDSSCADQPADT